MLLMLKINKTNIEREITKKRCQIKHFRDNLLNKTMQNVELEKANGVSVVLNKGGIKEQMISSNIKPLICLNV